MIIKCEFAALLLLVSVLSLASAASADEPSQGAKKPQLPASIKNVIAPAEMHPFGTAPGLLSKLVGGDENKPGTRKYMLRFRDGDDVIGGLQHFASEKKLRGATFNAIGAVQCAAVAYFDRGLHKYKSIPITEQAELVALSGNISTAGENYVVHGHAVLGLNDGKTVGGHLLWTSTWPTIECSVEETSENLTRSVDKDTNTMLLSF